MNATMRVVEPGSVYNFVPSTVNSLVPSEQFGAIHQLKLSYRTRVNLVSKPNKRLLGLRADRRVQSVPARRGPSVDSFDLVNSVDNRKSNLPPKRYRQTLPPSVFPTP